MNMIEIFIKELGLNRGGSIQVMEENKEKTTYRPF